ncbi:MAG: DUF3592 domain-containing protein, partial [Planctomycetaceae bacterium]|nr:DUF3592 domain-containing protein [Planctomycetaceae bacterium]
PPAKGRAAMPKSTSKLGGEIVGTGLFLFFIIFWSAITLGFDYFLIKASVQQIQALGHPTVNGTITSSEVEFDNDGEGTTYRPLIKYSYEVDRKQYEGNRYRYGQVGTSDHSAHRIVASHPVGKQVEVHHSPDDPADAVLHVGLEGIDLFMMMFMLPFNLIMLGMWLGALGYLRNRLIPPEAGGAGIINEGHYLRVQLSPSRPIYTGAAVAGGLAFAQTFIFGFGFGGNAPIPVMIVAWGIILVGGCIGFLYALRQLARGDSDLLIDDFKQTLTLPKKPDRHEEMILPPKKIVAFEVERKAKRDSDGDVQYRFLPTIVYTDNSGSQRREKLTEWSDETSAQALVEWLSERLQVKPALQASVDDNRNLEDA